VAADPVAAGHYGLRVFLSLVLLVVTFFVVRWLAGVLERLAEQSAARRLFYKRLIPILRITIWATALYAVIRVILDIGTAKLVAAATAIGVAVGFAAQDLLKNVFGGLVIILDQPFQVGDKVNIAGTYGEVTTIGLRSTRLVTPDDNLVSVPNAQVVDGQVSNANAGALDCQVVTSLYLAHDADEAHAKQIAYEAAASSRYVYLKKPIVVIVQETLDQRPVLLLKVKAYVLDTRFEFLLMSDVTERARQGFREAGLLPTTPRALAPPSGGDGRALASPPGADA
jgi:small-conductance mechanosensitive channel